MTRNRRSRPVPHAVILRLTVLLLLLFSLMLLSPSCPKITGNRPTTGHPPSTGNNPPWNCGPFEEWCGGRCVNTATFVNDSSNCGRCGNHCSMFETCTGGSCTCAPGYSMCMGSCMSDASFMSDTSNCGRCGNHCSFDETCMGGTCMKSP